MTSNSANFPLQPVSSSSSINNANDEHRNQNQQTISSTTMMSLLPLPTSASSSSSSSISSSNRRTHRYAPYTSSPNISGPVRSHTPPPSNQPKIISRNMEGTSLPESEGPSKAYLCSLGFVHQSVASRRLHTELKYLNRFPVTNCNAYPNIENILQWFVVIDGPKDTIYEDGTFFAELNFNSHYPFMAPEVLFLTRIYHCNISNQGKICLHTTSQTGWKPSFGLSTILQSIVSLLYACNPHQPLVPSIAEQYLHRQEEFNEIARTWTKRYAQ